MANHWPSIAYILMATLAISETFSDSFAMHTPAETADCLAGAHPILLWLIHDNFVCLLEMDR